MTTTFELLLKTKSLEKIKAIDFINIFYKNEESFVNKWLQLLDENYYEAMITLTRDLINETGVIEILMNNDYDTFFAIPSFQTKINNQITKYLKTGNYKYSYKEVIDRIKSDALFIKSFGVNNYSFNKYGETANGRLPRNEEKLFKIKQNERVRNLELQIKKYKSTQNENPNDTKYIIKHLNKTKK